RHIERLEREAENTARLSHPGIPAVFTLGRLTDGRPFFTQAWIEGDTLEEAARRLHASTGCTGHPFDRPWQASGDDRRHELARQLLMGLADAARILHYAHERGYLHRDVTPSNIVLGVTVGTAVVDWGLSRGPMEHKEPVAEAWD